MHKFSTNTQAALKLSPALLAAAALSACTSPRVGPTAGASSSWTPQSYERVTSSAAVTSTLGGSGLHVPVSASGVADYSNLSLVPITGSLTHNTGAITLDDGTYLFVDADGPTAGGSLADGAGAIGSYGNSGVVASASGYNYVTTGYIRYTTAGGQTFATAGYVGIVTAAADMPTGGTASYSGQASYLMINNDGSTSASNTALGSGSSAVNVDFGAGTASVDMHNFTNIKDGNGATLTAITTPLDEIKGTGLTISGAHITGGTWVTMKGGSVVNLLGASPVATSNGTFFGYDPAISAPAEVAGVVLVKGSTKGGFGSYIAQ